NLSERPVERSQLLFFADALAVGRIARHRSRLTWWRMKLGDILDFKVNQVADAGGASVASTKSNGIVANIETGNGRRQFLTNGATGLVSQFGPKLYVVIHPALEAEMLARESWRPMQSYPRRFDGQSSGAAHRIDERSISFPTCKEDNRGRQRLIQRRFRENGPVTALVQ